MSPSATSSARHEHVVRAHREYTDRNPQSRRHYDRARAVLPGGHTRTVLTHAPFPLTFVAGKAATITDIDGHTYIDLLGDYTAGLLGHSELRMREAVFAALARNTSVGGIHPAEADLAELMCSRFNLDRVRFTNSGSEANLMAVTTAMMATGRRRLMVFDGGYHGGLLTFAHGAAPWNVPYDVVLAPFNDLPSCEKLIAEHADGLAAVLIEPMMGSGGCLPADADFLQGLFATARRVGAVCIADEVMTSRHGPRGLAALLGAPADITTFGKYIGGGFSFGAFGGRADLLDQFDTSPEGARQRPISHAGTFNNNVASINAGVVVLRDIYTSDIAVAHTARGDEFRANLAAVAAHHDAPVSVTGFGSMMVLHALPSPPSTPGEADQRDQALQELIYFGLLERGVYTAARGMINLGLAHTDDQLAIALAALDDVLANLSRDQ
jgi:glutamate-1-semialdehyde 2,1-aminomutase